jgi:hypothetical protein
MNLNINKVNKFYKIIKLKQRWYTNDRQNSTEIVEIITICVIIQLW